MNYLKKAFKNIMLANIFWLIVSIIMVSDIYFTGGNYDYNPTVLNVSVGFISTAMFGFSSWLASKQGANFKKIFGY